MPTINSIEASYRLYLSRLSKQSTRKDYTMRFNVFLTWCSMERLDGLEEVNFPQFLDYVFLDRGVSPRTHNNYRTWLRSFTSWIRRQLLLEGDPLDGVPPMREPGKIRQPLPTAMLRQIREHLAAHDRHLLLAVMMEYYCFIRPEELSQLQVGDIDAKRHAIHVRAEISKNGKAEMVGLNTAIVSLMRELGTLRAPKDWYLFSNRLHPGKVRLDSRAFRDRWARLRRRLGIPREYQFYSLKDSGIRDLANSAGIVIARDQARHSSIAVTNKYLQGRDRPIHQATIKFKGAL